VISDLYEGYDSVGPVYDEACDDDDGDVVTNNQPPHVYTTLTPGQSGKEFILLCGHLAIPFNGPPNRGLL